MTRRRDPIGCTPAEKPLTQAGRHARRVAYREAWEGPRAERPSMPTLAIRLPLGLDSSGR